MDMSGEDVTASSATRHKTFPMQVHTFPLIILWCADNISLFT